MKQAIKYVCGKNHPEYHFQKLKSMVTKTFSVEAILLATPFGSRYGLFTCSFDDEPCSRSREVHSFLLQPPLIWTAMRSLMVMMALMFSFLLFLKIKVLSSPARRYYCLALCSGKTVLTLLCYLCFVINQQLEKWV